MCVFTSHSIFQGGLSLWVSLLKVLGGCVWPSSSITMQPGEAKLDFVPLAYVWAADCSTDGFSPSFSAEGHWSLNPCRTFWLGGRGLMIDHILFLWHLGEGSTIPGFHKKNKKKNLSVFTKKPACYFCAI